jgi:RNA recognition motif-containing protein
MKKIYVGNLPFSATDDDIRALFSEYGTVESVNLITDRDTGRPRGFGFVEMSSGADEAIEALHQKEMDGRSLNVNEARPRTDRPPRQRQGGGGGGGGYGSQRRW